MAKGEKIDRNLTVDYSGSSVVGNMRWETNFIHFKEGYRWQSDTILDDLVCSVKEGESVYINAFAYLHKSNKFKTLRRVKIQRIA